MAAITAGSSRARFLQAFKSRDFRLLWSGQAVSLLGDTAFVVALGWRTFTLTGSARSLGIVLTLQGVGLLSTVLVGGALADRYDRRTLMLVSDAARFGVIGALAVVDATGHLSLGICGDSRSQRAWRPGSSRRPSAGSCRSWSSSRARLGERADRDGQTGEPPDRADVRRADVRLCGLDRGLRLQRLLVPDLVRVRVRDEAARGRTGRVRRHPARDLDRDPLRRGARGSG